MRLGRFELKAVETGRFRLDGGAMFGVVPKALWEKTDPADDKNRISMHMRALFAECEGHRLLVDSGAGTKLDQKMIDIYSMESGPLRDIVAGRGIDPDSITDAVATHLHFDHAGGYTYYDAEGGLALALPNASHHIQRKQWETALDPNEKDRASFFRENFLPIEENGRLHLVDGEEEIFKGVKLIPTEGHTPGHQTVLIDTGDGKILYCGDLIPLASHLNLPYIMAYDHYPLKTLEEKKRILSIAADEDWILFFEHDPSVQACRVRINEKGRFEISDKMILE